LGTLLSVTAPFDGASLLFALISVIAAPPFPVLLIFTVFLETCAEFTLHSSPVS
jgi:hypothetical protein